MSIFPECPVPGLPQAAYFCMEFGLHPSLPIYSGGLGILAGDTIKSAGDLRLPFVGIGILWGEGYTVQRISGEGYPVDEYPPTPRDALTAVDAPGVTVRIRGKDVALRAFVTTKFGNAPLYLLEPEDPADRWITRRLYGGGADDRVAQELVLGVGGVRLLRALGARPDVFHFNEGHAVFAGLELIRERRVAGRSLTEAWQDVRRQIVFTTHTPVPAGNEVHPLERLLAQGADLGAFTPEELTSIGGDPFGMTVAGLRLARAANAVAELHGETSRAMWKDVPAAAPIVAVTNGVHAPTWQDPRIAAAYREGPGALLATHLTLKRELIAEIRARTGMVLDEQRLLVGFARRAATYKRADLIFRDPDVIAPLLASHRVQLVFAGKAHPADADGKQVIANLVTMARRWPGSVIFLENYEMTLAAKLVAGADVWLNNPRRPLEASGTSGMKAAMNGVLNVSILDGWWPEGCVHGVNGWQIGDEYEGPEQDERDLHALHHVLVDEVLATWETPGRARWGEMMKASIEMSRWSFSSDRMLEDYVRRLYVS